MSSSGASSTPVSPVNLTTVAASVVMSNKLASSDANAAFAILGDGTLRWGPGGAGALDTSLSRLAGGILTTAAFNADGIRSQHGATSVADLGFSAVGQIGFYGHAVTAQQLLATGAGHTVDDVITVLQALGLVKQA